MDVKENKENKESETKSSVKLSKDLKPTIENFSSIKKNDKTTKNDKADDIKIEIKETVYDTIHIKVYDTVPIKPKEVTKKVIIDSTEVTQVIQE